MSNVLLADEINRTIPRTQASLLESMGEFQVTVDGVTLDLPKPFFVIATQNPIEMDGTFPLPEAQLDRFLMKIDIGYPDKGEELAILERFLKNDPLISLEAVSSPGAHRRTPEKALRYRGFSPRARLHRRLGRRDAQPSPGALRSESARFDRAHTIGPRRSRPFGAGISCFPTT